MDTYVIIILAVIFSLILGLVFYAYGEKKGTAAKAKVGDTPNQAALPLRLQAYERLVLLTERIALPNLISRIGQQDLTAKDMQLLLTQTIRQEYEHNISQQIYVSKEAWEAVSNLKEQNMLIINQVASFLPPDASGTQLNKSLLDVLIQNPQASLHNIVAEALSYEAKQWM
ncbi:MAG: hypothetical protein INR73_08235 [Williamsia sp.]|nr:hypothetical protein [Williamsia sp.]